MMLRGYRSSRVTLLLCATLLCFNACAHQRVLERSEAATSAPHQQHGGHPLGRVEFPTSCSREAQAEFDRGIALLHHMTYPQAREAFERAAVVDPRCAMAQWGIATTLFQPLWPTRPGPEALERGWNAVQRAKALGAATERERLFIAAAEAFFSEPATADYWTRIARWEAASRAAYEAMPRDPEIALFYALAHLATTPANKITREYADRAAAILLDVYRQNPDHPGAMHYLVHANDVPGRERELLEITRKYESIAPRNPHALHMPTHIYTRLGDWSAVVRGNIQARDAALEHPAGERREYVWDEFAHAIEYLVYAYLQQGDDSRAAEELQRLLTTERVEPTFKTAFHIASSQARYALERRAWREAAQLRPRVPATLNWERFMWPDAILVFARGLGAAQSGDLLTAREAVARLEELDRSTTDAKEELFARNIRVMRLELSARIEQREGRSDEALRLAREAAELETSTPKHAVTPGPTFPAHELLGDLLLEEKRPAEALAAYRRALELYPRRYNALLGAARAAAGVGDAAAARTYYEELVAVAGASKRDSITEARSYLAR